MFFKTGVNTSLFSIYSICITVKNYFVYWNYIFTEQILFNMEQIIYPFLQKRSTSASVLDSGYLVQRSLWFLGTTLQATARLILSFTTGWEHVSGLGSTFWVAVLSNIAAPVCHLFIPVQLLYLVLFSYVSFPRCILHSWTPAHTFSLDSLNERFCTLPLLVLALLWKFKFMMNLQFLRDYKWVV